MAIPLDVNDKFKFQELIYRVYKYYTNSEIFQDTAIDIKFKENFLKDITEAKSMEGLIEIINQVEFKSKTALILIKLVISE